MASYCNVAFPLKTRQVFTYATGEFAGRLSVGQRVVVPFGRGSRTGFVVELLETAPERTDLKPVSRLFDNEPLLSDEIFRLAGWLADYYCAPLGENGGIAL